MKKKHCLSGVGQTIQVPCPGGPGNGGYVAPRGPERAVLGEPAEDDVRLTKIYDERYMAWWTHFRGDGLTGAICLLVCT